MIGGEKLKQVEYKVELYFKIMKEKVSTIIIYVLIALISFSVTSMIILGYYTKKEKEHNLALLSILPVPRVLFTFIFFGTCIGCIIKIVSMDNEIQELKENNEEIVLHYEDALQNVNIENENLKDSINYYKGMYNECVLLCDSLCEEIAVRDIKLARIAEYNRIAGQNNNIKYLRGWINRVLNN